VRLNIETRYVKLLKIYRDLRIALELRATEAQNRAIERARKAIVMQGRAI
jgi:hypothetical protein